MKEGWKTVSLGSVTCKSDNINWKSIDKDKCFLYVDLTSVDRKLLKITDSQEIDLSNAPSRAQRIIKENDIIFATTRPTLRRLCIIPANFNNQICSTGFCVLRPKDNILSSWIFYSLIDESFYKYIEPLQSGATYPAVTDKAVKGYMISLPSLPEQQRIVDILDAEFAKIDALKANAEKNLQNAKDLFQAALKKEFLGSVVALGDVLNLRRGHDLTHSEMILGDIPVAGSGGIIGYHNEATPISPCITVGRSGSVGKVNVYENCWAHNTVLYVDEFKGNYPYYLVYLLMSLDLTKMGGGCGVPTLNRNNLHPMRIGFNNDISKQQAIVARLDALSENCHQLQSNYEKTIALCDDMKQALLRKAFNGEL